MLPCFLTTPHLPPIAPGASLPAYSYGVLKGISLDPGDICPSCKVQKAQGLHAESTHFFSPLLLCPSVPLLCPPLLPSALLCLLCPLCLPLPLSAPSASLCATLPKLCFFCLSRTGWEEDPLEVSYSQQKTWGSHPSRSGI